MTRKLIGYAALVMFAPWIMVSHAQSVTSTDPRLLTSSVPNTVFLLEQGYIDWPATSGTTQQYFNTKKVCPRTFTPYAVIRFSKVSNSSGNDFIQGFGACVNGLSNLGTYYTVGYLVSREYATASKNNNSGLYVGTSKGAWTIWSTQKMPATSSMSTTQQDSSQIGGFYWDTYCYPPGITPPSMSGCT